MGRIGRWGTWAAVALAAAVVVSGCADGGAQSRATALKPGDYTVPTPEISSPPAEGAGISRPQPAVPAPAGYTEQELFVSGTATSFKAVDTPDNGRWTVSRGHTADYRTRIVVRRPPPEKFSGTVIVEWFNVSAIETGTDWAYLGEEIGREGDAYVGVSAQARGVEGGGTPLVDVNVDAKAAAAAGVDPDASGLKHTDPARYGTLEHPGDAYAFDIFSQVGRAVAKRPDLVLGGLVPKQVIAVGQSQSAGFLTTVANAIHPLDPVYDGFLIHSRGANPAPLDGKYKSNAHGKSTGGADFTKGSVQVRTDLHVPTLMFETETDVELLGYANARQPDSDSVRAWEVAGTSHADAHVIRSLIGGPRDPSVGSLVGCTEPINTGPHHEVLQAALHHLVDWTAGGDPPPKAKRIELQKGKKVVIARDGNGIAIGGVRNPLVDVPIAATTGEPPGNADLAKADVCGLFGTTVSFDQAKLVELYGTFDNYLQKFEASAAEAVAGGFLVQADADALIAEAQQNAALFPAS